MGFPCRSTSMSCLFFFQNISHVCSLLSVSGATIQAMAIHCVDDCSGLQLASCFCSQPLQLTFHTFKHKSWLFLLKTFLCLPIALRMKSIFYTLALKATYDPLMIHNPHLPLPLPLLPLCPPPLLHPCDTLFLVIKQAWLILTCDLGSCCPLFVQDIQDTLPWPLHNAGSCFGSSCTHFTETWLPTPSHRCLFLRCTYSDYLVYVFICSLSPFSRNEVPGTKGSSFSFPPKLLDISYP